MLDTITIASEAVKASHTTDNTSRSALRKIARKLINDSSVVTPAMKSDFQARSGESLNGMIDKVHRNVLLDIIADGLSSATGNPDAMRSCMDRMAEAWKDDSLCQPAERGSGVSRGYHTACQPADKAVAYIKSHCTQQTDSGIWRIDITPQRVANAIQCAARMIRDQFGLPKEMVDTDNDIADIESRYNMRIVNRMMNDVPVDQSDNSLLDGIQDAVYSRDYDQPIEYDSLTASGQERVDDLCRRYIQMYDVAGEVNASPEKPAEAPKDDGIVVDPNLKQGVDLMLNQATKGKLTDINVLIEGMERNTKLEEELSKLRDAQMVPNFATSGTDVVDEATLTYEVVMRKASDIFLSPHGKKSAKLDFEVPTLVWRNDAGEEVRHPMCPEIDHTYQFRQYMLIKFLSAIKFGHNSWLHGHTGTGKTTFIEQVAAWCGFPVERLNLDSNLERADVIGGKEIEVENGAPITVYREGILPRAMAKPCWFICDEIDAGRADMLFVLQRALEGKGLTITEDAGRVVKPHDMFRFVATANSRGQGDEFGFYAGVRPMNIAMLDRFTMFIEVPYLDKDDEMRLLKTAYPKMTENERSEFCEFSQKVRQAFCNGEISKTLSPRGLHSMASYYLHFKSLMPNDEARLEAAKVAVIDAAPADNRHTIEQMFTTLVG